MRQTPMRRGALSSERRALKNRIAAAIHARNVPEPLAQRIAFQLVLKYEGAELGGEDVWSAIGGAVAGEIASVRGAIALEERQLVEALPKLSADDIERLFVELCREDRRIARTILNVALVAVDPAAAARHYLSAYRTIMDRLGDVEPVFARTIANAAFTAASPVAKALELATVLHADRMNSPHLMRLVKRNRPWADARH
jgi:hypothetical protein